jgi:hypothetical protein
MWSFYQRDLYEATGAMIAEKISSSAMLAETQYWMRNYEEELVHAGGQEVLYRFLERVEKYVKDTKKSG